MTTLIAFAPTHYCVSECARVSPHALHQPPPLPQNRITALPYLRSDVTVTDFLREQDRKQFETLIGWGSRGRDRTADP